MGALFDISPADPLALTEGEVARLTRPEREARLDELIAQSQIVLSDAIGRFVIDGGHRIAALAVGFSGGNDSTTLTHLFRKDVDFALHANTTIGIEETRDFVRNTCEEWGLTLVERTPPRETDHYRSLVLTRDRGKKGQALGGFPGPAMHFKMFQRLKERAIEQVQREVIANPRKERMVVILGRRRSESERRKKIGLVDRRGSRVNVSPLANWTKADLNTYRLRHQPRGDWNGSYVGRCEVALCRCAGIPTNKASGLIHMSGECLCGSFASPGERDEIAYWFPGPFAQIAELEAALADRDDIPEHRKTWGWGADPAKKRAEVKYLKQFDVEAETPRSGDMCSSCDDRFQLAIDFGGA